jgi:hypothetical protein
MSYKALRFPVSSVKEEQTENSKTNEDDGLLFCFVIFRLFVYRKE